jgi:drug/metabolite transporter (DMT)-like permease
VTAPSVALGVAPLTAPLAAVLAVVVLTSVAGQVLLHHGLGFAPAVEGSLAAATSVLTAALLEAALLGEHLAVASLAGGALLVAAVGLALRRPTRAR